jgi:hypothetical protein
MTDSKAVCWRLCCVFSTVVLLGVLAVSQDHAPLPEQCNADAKLWFSADKADLDKQPYAELERRVDAMWDCHNSSSVQMDKQHFSVVLLTYQAQESNRMAAYLKRHGLTKEFLAEDAAGKR